MTRDKLIVLFWPEADTAQARHLLADSIYVLRDALGEEALLLTGDDVALNGEHIGSDVTEFWLALDGGDRARAVAVYTGGGPFLDGVHVADAPEFERWADSVRGRVETDFRRALEDLANDAAHRGDHKEAVVLWRRLAAEDPLSSRVGLKLMRALVATGDSAAALEFARVHEQLVRSELDAAPDPALAAFADQLRTGVGLPTSVQEASIEDANIEVAQVDAAQTNAAMPGVVPIEAERRRAPRRALWATLGGLAVAAALLVGIQVAHEGGFITSANPVPMAEPIPSIVVLPLVNSSGAENESFADGLTEEITDALAKTEQFRVIASTSAFVFKGRPTDVRKIASTLRVRYLIEGSIEHANDRSRVHVRLVDGSSGATLWSEIYDRTSADQFSIEGDLGRAIAAQLNVRLVAGIHTSAGRRGTTSVAAYEFFVRGRDPQLLRSDSGVGAAADYFRRAIALDSGYANAYAGLSRMYAVLALGGNFAKYPPRAMYDSARTAALRAVALDDSLANGHVELAFALLLGGPGQRDVIKSDVEIRRAIELEPTSSRAYSTLLYGDLWRGRAAEGVVAAQRALQSDPLSATATRDLANALFFARRYEDALAVVQTLRNVQPPLRATSMLAARIYAATKRFPEALAELSPVNGPARNPSLRGFVLARAGQRAEAETVIQDLISRWRRRQIGAFDIALVYAGLADYDNAFAWLDRSLEDGSVRYDIMSPNFDDLRADPRFRDLARRLGI
jgi:TolB-like protein/DNA-binding SARP family transcriptional activator